MAGLTRAYKRRPGGYIRDFAPAIWFDAADASTLYQSNGGALAAADGDPVGYWLDKSGNGRHAEQTTAGNKPILKLAVKNGKNAVLFNGTTTSLSSASFSMPAMPSASRWAFFVINNPVLRSILFMHGTTDSNENFAQLHGQNGYASDIGNNAGPYVDSLASTGSGYRQFSMVWTRPTTTSILTAINNGVQTVPAITGGSTTTPNTNSVPFTLGLRLGNYFSSHICELIYGSTVLTSDQIAGIHNYLNAKWAIY